MMKIAITGASGFIGTEIIKQLRNTDVQIVAFTRGDTKNYDTCNGSINWFQTDYSFEKLEKQLSGVDTIIHLAATRGTTGLISDYFGNEVITENILRAMGTCKVKHIVFASSIAVYSDIAQIPWKEDTVLSPKTLYGITKAGCEHLCAYYSRINHFTFTILRIAQVLGTNERRRGMMNVFIDAAKDGRQLTVLGKSIAKRQYIFVDDLAAVFVKASLSDQSESKFINVGMKNACSNLEIAQIVNEVFENETPILYDDSFAETCEPSCMDTQYLTECFGYEPKEMQHALKEIRRQMNL